jgi:uncharacterized protein YecT (DUF1311 family)
MPARLYTYARSLVVAIAVAGFCYSTAHAACAATAAPEEVVECLAQDLRDSDRRINADYQTLIVGLDEAGKSELRAEQRAWLKKRAQACGLDTRKTDREEWLRFVLADQARTICTVRWTFARDSELHGMLARQFAGPPTLLLEPSDRVLGITFPGPSPHSADDEAFGFLDDGYMARSSIGHDRGKWYAEVFVDWPAIVELGDTLVAPGFFSAEHRGQVRLLRIRSGQLFARSINMAMAIDIDNGFVYFRERGSWDVLPGLVTSTQVQSGILYYVSIEGSSDIRELMRRGLIKVNLGATRFEYQVPAGYKPFIEH